MMKSSTKLKIAIEAIEHRQKFYVFNSNAFKLHEMPFGEKAAEQWDRLEEAKEFIQELLQKGTWP